MEEGLGGVQGNKALNAKMLGIFLTGKEIGLLEQRFALQNISFTALSLAITALIESRQAGRWDEKLIVR